MIRWAVVVSLACGCYHGDAATRDVNAAWQGRTRAELEGTWGAPAGSNATSAAWSFTTTHVELPSAAASIAITPTSVDVNAVGHTGEVWKTQTTATATFDAGGRIAELRGPSLHWGAPRDANLRWGTIFGLHAGLGPALGAAILFPHAVGKIGNALVTASNHVVHKCHGRHHRA